jgi:predicted outer membrane repeat protein
VSAFRVLGGTCTALKADRSNLTVVDSRFERINATLPVSVDNSNATISGSTFRGLRGPALASQGSTILVQNVLFEDNVATRGGAIRSTSGALQIVASQFFDNDVWLDGGAIFADTLNITGSLFRGNRAGDDGAAIFGDDIRINECDFEGNNARSVVYVRSPKTAVVIAKSSFFGNTIRFANDTGGVVQVFNAAFQLRVTESCLCNNTRASFSCTNLTGSLVVDNTTVSQGALSCPLTQFQPSNCTTAGCERRVPGLATTTATTTTTTTTTAIGTPTIAPTTASSTASTTSSTAARVPETASSSSPDGGTLGAIIGGCIAGVLIIGGIVAFVVIRKRKQSLPTADAVNPKSEYGPIALKEYDDPSSVRAPHTSESNYGSALTNLN